MNAKMFLMVCVLVAIWLLLPQKRESYTSNEETIIRNMITTLKTLGKKSTVPTTPTTPTTPTKPTTSGDWKPAYATYYNSYPDCCKKSPHYNPSAPKEECSSYDGCQYLGQFSGLKGRLTYDQVKARNIVSFYDAKNQSKTCNKKNQECAWWNANVKGKKIAIKHPTTGKELIVEPLDTCNDADTSNKDCTKNANMGGGTLIDMEIFTARRFWPNGKETNGKILWKFV